MGRGVPKVGDAPQRGPAALSLRDFFLARPDFRALSAALVANSRVNSKRLTPRSRESEHLFTWGRGGGVKSLEGSRADRWPRNAHLFTSFRIYFFGACRIERQ